MRASIHPLELVLGLVVWSAWFVALYGGLSLACAYVPPDPRAGAATWLNTTLAAFTFIVAAWLAGRAYACWREAPAARARRRFVAMVAAGVYASAAIATLVVGVPVLLLPPCT
jgi:hypothetical protein